MNKRTYYVFVDYGYTTERELFASTDLLEARQFYTEYVNDSPTTAMHSVELAWFASDDEYITEERTVFDEDFSDEPLYDLYSD
jgi:hypothetical protein